MLSGGWVGQKKRGEVNLIPVQCLLEPQNVLSSMNITAKLIDYLLL